MLLWQVEHVEPILDGSKTQTRRLWSRWRVKEGSLHLCYTRPAWCNPPGEPFGQIAILRRWREPLGEISPADALAEGYPSPEAYLEAFRRINRLDNGPVQYLHVRVHCVEFECVADLRRAA